MKNNKNVRKDNLSPVENGSKRIYKMYKSKKNWVVAPVVLLTLLGAVAPAPIALTNVVNAEETTTATTELDAAKSDVTNKIKGLGLSDEATRLKTVESATTAEDAFKALKEAYTQAVNLQVTDFNKKATEAITAIKKVENLETDAATYTNKVTVAQTAVSKAFDTFYKDLIVTTQYHDDTIDKDVTRDNYVDQRKVFDAELAKQTPILTSALEEAKQQAKLNSDYEVKKADVIAQINNLSNLTSAEKDVYLAQVNKIDADYDKNLDPDKADWIKKLQDVLTDAKTADTAKAAAELQAAKDEANSVLAAATKLSSDAKAAFQKQINELKAAANVDSLIKAIKDADAKAKFENYKKTLVSTFNSTNLSESQRQSYVNQANNATTYEELANIKAAYDDAVVLAELNTKDLKSLKEDVTKRLESTDNRELFGGLTTLEKGDYQFAVKVADSKDAVISIFKEAQAKSREAISAAKDEATKTINALTHLSDSEKGTYLPNVQSATSLAGVKAVVDQAKAADTENELAAAVKNARYTVAKMKYLTSENASKYNTELNNAKTLKDVEASLTNAAKQNLLDGLKEAIAVKDLDLAKEVGKEVLNYLPNLSDTEKANAIKDIDAAKSAKDVDAAYQEALKVSETNSDAKQAAKALADAKDNAVNTINAYKYISSSQKADYVAKVKATKNSTELDIVVKAAATAESTAEKAAKALSEAKQKVLAEISDDTAATYLKHLTEAQRDEFVAQVLRAGTIDAVKSIERSAQDTNFAQIPTEAEFLEAIKSWTKDTTYLNPDQKTALDAAIKDVKDLDAMKQAYKAAIAKADAQNDVLVMKELDALIKDGLYETAKTKLAELRVDSNKAKYVSQVDSLLALRDAKANAQSEIEKADYASAKQKEGLLNSLSKADSVDAVNKVLDQLHALQPAEAVQLYRLYNPYSHEHLYTASKDEYDYLGTIGWQQEEFAWTAPSKGEEVYRLYNPFSGEHFYTMSTKEYNDLAKLGWKQEGLAFYSNSKDGNPLDGSVSIYRLFNPYEKGAGSHHFTTSTEERDHLVSLGWNAEGVGFFGLKK